MFSRASVLLIAMLILGGHAGADELALAKKGTKQPPETIEMSNFAFDGMTLMFSATGPSGQTEKNPILVRQVAANEWAIEIQLAFTQISLPGGAFKPNPVFTYYQPNLGAVKAPELYDSVNQATHDVGLQQAQLQDADKKKAGTTGGYIGSSLLSTGTFASVGFPSMHVGDLTRCKGPGQDWIVKGNDAQRTHVQGKILGIAKGWLTFRNEGGATPQKYRLYSEVVAIGIGTCP